MFHKKSTEFDLLDFFIQKLNTAYISKLFDAFR